MVRIIEYEPRNDLPKRQSGFVAVTAYLIYTGIYLSHESTSELTQLTRQRTTVFRFSDSYPSYIESETEQAFKLKIHTC